MGDEERKISRRDFLKVLGLGAGAAVALIFWKDLEKKELEALMEEAGRFMVRPFREIVTEADGNVGQALDIIVRKPFIMPLVTRFAPGFYDPKADESLEISVVNQPSEGGPYYRGVWRLYREKGNEVIGWEPTPIGLNCDPEVIDKMSVRGAIPLAFSLSTSALGNISGHIVKGDSYSDTFIPYDATDAVYSGLAMIFPREGKDGFTLSSHHRAVCDILSSGVGLGAKGNSLIGLLDAGERRQDITFMARILSEAGVTWTQLYTCLRNSDAETFVKLLRPEMNKFNQPKAKIPLWLVQLDALCEGLVLEAMTVDEAYEQYTKNIKLPELWDLTGENNLEAFYYRDRKNKVGIV